MPEIDGLWWPEWEADHSAPRGILLPERLARWRVTERSPLDAWEPDPSGVC